MNEHEDYENDWKTNRQKKLEYKSGYYWCGKCDCFLVRDWEKCGNCGYRNSVRRNKWARK